MLPDLPVAGGVLRFRSETDADFDTMKRVYASVRADELDRVTDWPDAAKQAFIDQQFQAQHAYYRQRYPQGRWLVILFDDAVAGRLYYNRTAERIHIIDIALHADFRGRGLGTRILERLFDEGLPVRIYVERFNPAVNLYRRLGFRMIDDSNQVYWLMERPA